MAEPMPFVDLRREHDELSGELEGAFRRVWRGSTFILGEEVEAFEREFAAYCGVEHCVGVASGTAALTLAMRAAGIGPGDEVIVPTHTYIASALAVVHAGADPVFCDVVDATGLIDLDSAASAVRERTAAVLPVHLYGQACDMEAVLRFAERRGLAVFEDAAQAHGATWAGRRAGSWGTAAAFSFYPTKNLGALGDGGAICTSDSELAAAARRLRDLGQRSKGEHVLIGFNERLDALQAAFLRAKLPHLERWNERRRAAASAYRRALLDKAKLLPERSGARCVYHVFPVRLERRDAVASILAEAGVSTGVHYSPPVHRQPPFEAGRESQHLPVAERWAAEELSLPMFPGVEESDAQRVAGLLAMAISRANSQEFVRFGAEESSRSTVPQGHA